MKKSGMMRKAVKERKQRTRQEETMKDMEFKLISELMKNGRKSDRELAKAIGSSQPTVTRARRRLEKQGIIKEYTMIPNFSKLGYELLAVTFSRFSKKLSNEERDALRKKAREIADKNHEAVLIAAKGMGLGFDRVFISLHRNYSSYMKVINLMKTLPNLDSSQVESFVISLVDETNYQPLTFLVIAKCLLKMKE